MRLNTSLLLTWRGDWYTGSVRNDELQGENYEQ